MRRPTMDFVLIALAAAAAACGGEPASPVLAPTARISLESAATEVDVGASILLAATVLNESGQPLRGRTLEWVSGNPAVATVTNQGTVGRVTGVSAGTVVVSASSEGKMASATITVRALPVCAANNALSVSVGEVVPLSAAQRLTLCVGASAASEYVLVVANSLDATAVTIAPTNTSRVDTPVVLKDLIANSVSSYTFGSRSVGSRSVESHSLVAEGNTAPLFMSAFPFRSDVLRLEPATRNSSSVDKRAPLASAAIAAQHAEGDTVSFNVNLADASCTATPIMHQARVVKVLSNVIVYLDLQAATLALTDDELAGLAAVFDTTIYPLDTLNFGPPADVNVDGRVGLFFTSAASNAGYAGVVMLRDFVGSQSCPAGNKEDLIYLGIYGSQKQGYLESMPYLLAHELTHVIHASTIYSYWWSEPMAHVAGELLFYKLTGLAPRANLNANFADPYTLEQFLEFSPQIWNYLSYLRAPESNSPISNIDSRDTRGAGWNYLRFVADRNADNPAVSWRNMPSVADFTRSTQRDTTMLLDWAVSNVMDDVLPAVPARYQNLSWNIRSMSAALMPYTLVKRDLVGDPVTIPLVRGGTSYLQFRVEAGKIAFIRATSNGEATAARMALIRTR